MQRAEIIAIDWVQIAYRSGGRQDAIDAIRAAQRDVSIAWAEAADKESTRHDARAAIEACEHIGMEAYRLLDEHGLR